MAALSDRPVNVHDNSAREGQLWFLLSWLENQAQSTQAQGLAQGHVAGNWWA